MSYWGIRVRSSDGVGPQRDEDLCHVEGAADLWGYPQNMSEKQQSRPVTACPHTHHHLYLGGGATITHLEFFWIEQLLLDLLQSGLLHRLLGHWTHRVLGTKMHFHHWNVETVKTGRIRTNQCIFLNLLPYVLQQDFLPYEDTHPAPVPEAFNLFHLKLIRFQHSLSIV